MKLSVSRWLKINLLELVGRQLTRARLERSALIEPSGITLSPHTERT